MKISVIMLTYNREKLVADAVRSILDQTFGDFEYIIVDNGSDDKSGLIVEEFARADDRIRVVHIPKSNIGTGRNTGLKSALGDYIAFVDDDDTASPDMLEFLLKLADGYDADISICGSTKKKDGRIVKNYVFDDILVMNAAEAVAEMLKRKRYNVGMPTKLFRRHLFDNIRFFESGRYDDITVGYRLLAGAKRVVAHGLPKYCILRHEGNNSAFTTYDKLLNPGQLNEYLDAFRERTEYLKRVLPEIGDFACYSEWSYMISMCNKIVQNDLADCREPLARIKKELTEHYGEFYHSPYIEEFEKEFMRRYIEAPGHV